MLVQSEVIANANGPINLAPPLHPPPFIPPPLCGLTGRPSARREGF